MQARRTVKGANDSFQDTRANRAVELGNFMLAASNVDYAIFQCENATR